MAESVRGINVVIGADTTKLSKALSDVNQKSKDIQSELRQVERLLKFDPSNTELLAQKQKLLADAVANTQEKLNRLKNVQQQVSDQLARGEISEGQYRAFQREVAKTEQELQRLQGRLQGMEQEQQKIASSTKQLETLFKATGISAEKFADILGTDLTNVIIKGTASSKQLDEAITKIGQAALGTNIDIDKMKKALSSVDDGNSLKNVKKELDQLAKEAKEAEKSVGDLGIELENVAGAIVAGGGIAGAIEKALDVSTLKTKIDVTFEVPESSKKSVEEAVRSIETYGVDAEAALEGVRRQWALNKDASDEANTAIVKGAAAIASVYSGIDFTELIQEINEISSELNISNEEALGLTNALLKIGFPPEQLDIIAEYGQQLKRAGYTAQEIQALFAAGIETGTWNIDNLLDGLKEGRIRVAEFGQEVPKAVKELLVGTGISAKQMQEWGKAVAKGGEQGSQAMREIAVALNNVDDETKKNALGVAIFGTMYEDQGQNIINTLLNAKNATVDFRANQEQLNSAVSKMDASSAVRLQQAFADLKTASEPMLGVIADVVSKVAEWVSENPKLAATIAGVASVLGILVGALMALAPIFTAIATTAGMLGVSIGAIVAPIGIAIAAIAGLTAGGIALYNHFKQSSIEVDLFGENVSKATQKAVGGFLKLNDQVTQALNQLDWSGQVVTQSIVDNIVSKFNQMGDQVLTEMQKDHQTQLTEMQNFFAQSSALTEEEEEKALEKLQQHYQEQQNTIQQGQQRIAEILNTAKEQKRAITDAERQEINQIQQQMVETGIQHLSQNELEAKSILERMKAQAGELTAQQAAEVVKNSNKQKEEAIKAANEQYDKVVQEIIRQRDEVGSISREQANKLIQEATRQRDEAVKKATDMHNQVVSEAQKQANEHVDKVNWETGEVLSKWEVFKNNLKIKWEEIQSNTSTKLNEIGTNIKNKFEEAKTSAQNKVEEMKNSVRNKFEELKVSVQTKMSEAKNKITEIWNEAQSFFSNIDLKQIGKDIIQGLIDGISSMAGALWKKAKDIADSIKETIQSALDIHSPSRVMRDEIGKWIPLGIAEGISRNIDAVVSATNRMAQAAIPSVPGIAVAGGGTVQTTHISRYGNVHVNVTIPVSDLEQIRTVNDFFNRLGMKVRQT
jgi:phage-related minor tail protein